MMRMFRTTRRFLLNQAGNMSLIVALAAVPGLGAAGAAIDYARKLEAHDAVVAAVDGAVLAGAQALLESDGDKDRAEAVAKQFFDSAMAIETSLNVEQISFEANADADGMNAKGTAFINTSLLKVLGISQLEVFSATGAEGNSAEISVEGPSSDLEVSIMLDVTGSMCADREGPCTGGSNMDSLKSAAATLVDKVVWDDQSKYTSRVAITPFSTRVRVAQDGAGAGIMNKLTGLTPNWSGWYNMCVSGSGSGASESGGNWTCNKYVAQSVNNWKVMPCVTDRYYDATGRFDLTDSEPKAGTWLNGHDGSRMTIGPDSSSTRATVALGRRRTDPASHWNYNDAGECADVAEANEVLPLTNDKNALKAKISSLEAYGSTSGVLGTAFAWYLISPNWKNVWTGKSQPKAYTLLNQLNAAGKPKLRKVAILMSDGVYNTFRGRKDQNTNDMSTNAIAMCSAMKKAGIEIFTVGFNLDGLSAAEQAVATNTMRSCGSTVDHFYNSLDPNQLADAFESIGNKVSSTSLRLVK
jgi:Flp pilus assembly protein TadG